MPLMRRVTSSTWSTSSERTPSSRSKTSCKTPNVRLSPFTCRIVKFFAYHKRLFYIASKNKVLIF
jgi:hypothetical protein